MRSIKFYSKWPQASNHTHMCTLQSYQCGTCSGSPICFGTGTHFEKCTLVVKHPKITPVETNWFAFETCVTNVNIAAFSLMYTRLQRLRACTCQTAASFLIVKHISFGGCPGMVHTPLLTIAKLGVFYQGSPALGGAGLTSCPDRSHH